MATSTLSVVPIAPDGHHRDYILLLFVGLARKSTLVCLFVFFFFSESRTVSHSPFACKWQNKLWDSEPVIGCFLSNKGGTLNIQIPRNSSKLHPTPCICDVCRVRRLGLSCTSKQNILSLILLIPLVKLMNQNGESIDTAFCTLYDLGPHSPMMLEM